MANHNSVRSQLELTIFGQRFNFELFPLISSRILNSVSGPHMNWLCSARNSQFITNGQISCRGGIQGAGIPLNAINPFNEIRNIHRPFHHIWQQYNNLSFIKILSTPLSYVLDALAAWYLIADYVS